MAKIIMLQIKNDLGEIVFDYGSIDKIVKEVHRLKFRIIHHYNMMIVKI